METRRAYLLNLLNRYLRDECDENEKFELLLALEDLRELGWLEEALDEEARELLTEKVILDSDVSQRMFRKLEDSLEASEDRVYPDRNDMFKSILRVAAAIVAVVGVGLLIVKEPGARHHLSAISTSDGQKRTVVLADGSLATLNGNSKISFVNGQKERRLRLEGEAYFDIAHDSLRPFFVQTSQIELRVLGTVFNVRSYPDDSEVSATLISGKVKVRSLQNEQEVIELNPDEQLTFNKSSASMQKRSIESESKASWRVGNLYFEEESAAVIFSELEKWFKVKINIDEVVADCRFSLKIEDESIDDVLGFFVKTADIRVNRKNEMFFLEGKLCE